MLVFSNPYQASLGDGLILKSIANEQDVERLAQFNGAIHDQGEPLVANLSRQLMLHHPATRPDYWLYIEDETTGQIVSALCLIPWRWRYEDVELKAGEMGIVGTLESYRGRGLVRALDRRFKELLAAGEYDISHIQGIPYFYRQFGYEYALPLEGGYHVPLHTVPPIPEGVTFRKATVDDIPTLVKLYDAASSALSISAVRDAETWAYLFGPAQQTETASDFWLVYQAGEPSAYWRHAHHGFGNGLIVAEVSALSVEAAAAVLGHAGEIAQEKHKPYIRLNIPRKHTLAQVALAYGGHDTGTYAWQIHIPDARRLLNKLRPIFERRIADSPFAGLDRSFVVNLYRQAVEIRFESGRCTQVNALGYQDDGDLNIPPNVFVPLVLGYRSREELAANYPDLGCWGENQLLGDTLFPTVESFLYTNY